MRQTLNSHIVFLLAALFVPCSTGCATTPRGAAPTGSNYRTIAADPVHDMDAAIAANNQGLMHLDHGNLVLAEEAFKYALEADVTYGPAHNHLGKVYYLKRDYYKAAHEFDEAIRLLPRHAEPRNNLGLTLQQGGKLDDAVDQFRAAAALDPASIAYQANLVKAMIQRGDRTPEVASLLRHIVENDDRVDWRAWASHRLGEMGETVGPQR